MNAKLLTTLALVWTAIPAIADVSASASLGPLVIQLTDLDPLDDVTPAFALYQQVSVVHKAWAEGTSPAAPSSPNHAEAGVNLLEPISIEFVTAHSFASVALSANDSNTASGATILLTGTASGQYYNETNRTSYFGASLQAYGCHCGWGSYFIISPQTKVTIFGLAAVSSQVSNSDAVGTESSASISFLAYNDTIPGISFGDQISAHASIAGLILHDSDTKVLGGVIENASSTEEYGTLQILTQIGGTVVATPVPEAATSRFLSIGLLALAALQMLRLRKPLIGDA